MAIPEYNSPYFVTNRPTAGSRGSIYVDKNYLLGRMGNVDQDSFNLSLSDATLDLNLTRREVRRLNRAGQWGLSRKDRRQLRRDYNKSDAATRFNYFTPAGEKLVITETGYLLPSDWGKDEMIRHTFNDAGEYTGTISATSTEDARNESIAPNIKLARQAYLDFIGDETNDFNKGLSFTDAAGLLTYLNNLMQGTSGYTNLVVDGKLGEKSRGALDAYRATLANDPRKLNAFDNYVANLNLSTFAGNKYGANKGKFGWGDGPIASSPELTDRDMYNAYNTMKANNILRNGGKMYKYQQGGAAPQLDMLQQVVALVQAAMQGDKQATDTINQIMQAAQQGDQQAMQLAQMIQLVALAMQLQGGQTPAARYGTKLAYIHKISTGCNADEEPRYFKQGGHICMECVKKQQEIEINKCGGKTKKPKKCESGAELLAARCGGKAKKAACGTQLSKKACGGKALKAACGTKVESKKCGGKKQYFKKGC